MAERRDEAGSAPEVSSAKLELRRRALAARDALPGAFRARQSVARGQPAPALLELGAGDLRP